MGNCRRKCLVGWKDLVAEMSMRMEGIWRDGRILIRFKLYVKKSEQLSLSSLPLLCMVLFCGSVNVTTSGSGLGFACVWGSERMLWENFKLYQYFL